MPTEFDGIYAQLQAGITAGTVSGNHIIDAAAQPLSSVTLVNQAVATVKKFQNFGRSTDIFLSPLVQADFDTGLDPTFRVPLTDVPGGGVSIGAPVIGIRTSGGNLAMNSDVFVRDDDMMIPFEVQQPALAAANNYTPVSVTAAAASNASSKFTASQAGNYYYYVSATTAAGESVGVRSSQVAISAGQGVTLTITRSAAATETGYVIYRTRLNGTNYVGTGSADGLSDFRSMTRIPVSGATTTYVDLNTDIPGTSKAYILNMTAGDTAILWRQLLPMLKFSLYPTSNAVIPWAQLLFGYLRISKLRHHVVIKNIRPNGATFLPFNV